MNRPNLVCPKCKRETDTLLFTGDDQLCPECKSRLTHWREMIREIEPDERERIRKNPEGIEAVTLGLAVELRVQSDMARREALIKQCKPTAEHT